MTTNLIKNQIWIHSCICES